MDTLSLELPNYTTADLQRALAVIQSCRKDPLPDYGFPCPYISPGGMYGGMWWQLDYSLALTGLLWSDHTAALDGIRNFAACQKPDGRIPLWGNDRLPHYNGERLQREQTSSLPKLFDAIARILRRTQDQELLRTGYNLLKRYLDWWLAQRYDRPTGLFSAVFEETFIPYFGYTYEYAPVDLNVELVHGFHVTAALASRLGRRDEADRLRSQAQDLAACIDRLLWNDEAQFYLPLQLQTRTHLPLRMASAFAALRYRIASPAHARVLLDVLTNVNRFNWNRRGLTSVDQTDPAFTLVSGRYNGNPSWSGSVWTLTNENAIRGLMDYGQHELAAQLLVHTLDLFKSQYCEFLNPATGTPCGVMDYAWTAATCLDLIFSVLLGIDYDATTDHVTVSPTLPAAWQNQKLTLRNLPLPNHTTLNLEIVGGEIPQITQKIC